MIKTKKQLKSSKGHILKTKYGLFQEVTLGTSTMVLDGKVTSIKFNDDEIEEVLPVFIDGDIYYISSTNYENAVSELIRQKNSIDDELALLANARLGNHEDEERQYQAWRARCKEVAKQIFK